MVCLALFRGQILGCRTTDGRAFPAGQFLVASLGIGMAPAVHLGEPGTAGVASVNAHLLDVFAVARDQGAKPGEVPGAVEVWAWAKRIAVAPS